MKARLLLAALITAAAFPAHSQENARNLAAACAMCHGTGGRAVTKDVVSLAGKPRDEIASQMRAFRDGNRPVTVMHQIAKGYTDAQIDVLAAYFAVQTR